MARYKQREVFVEAIQWNKLGDHPNDYNEAEYVMEGGITKKITREEAKARKMDCRVVSPWKGGQYPGGGHPDKPCEYCARPLKDHGLLLDGYNGQLVCPGDMVGTIEGRHFVMHPNEFAARYKEAD